MAIWSARRYFENVLYYSVPVDHTGSLNNKQTRKDQHLAMGMHVSEGTALSCRKRRLINCFFGLIVVFTMLSMVVLTLFLFGVIPGDGCGMEDGCSRDVAEEVDAIDDILQVSTAAPVLSLNDQKMEHRPKKLTQSKLREFAALTDIDRFMGPEILDPLLRVRVPGTPGNAEVRQFIVSSLQRLQSWDIEEDQSTHWTPHNRANTDFVNVIATLRNPNAQPESDLKLVLACHYDSKHFPNDEFIGATDSAVPCAMLLDLAHNLKASLDAKTYMPYTLQLIFFDGEEAFVQWTSTDSLYGSRHLAQKWANMPHHSVSKQKVLDGIGLFVLLDLLGTSSPNFKNFFSTNTQSNRMYKHLQNIENRLAQNNELISYSEDGPYFSGSTSRGMIEDDHKPFLERGVDVVHVIATPFPSVWHRPTDNKSALNRNTIANLNKIFHVFVAEFLHLKPPQ